MFGTKLLSFTFSRSAAPPGTVSCKKRKEALLGLLFVNLFVALTGIEPVTQGFSVLCSTN